MSERRLKIILPLAILILGAVITVVVIKSRRPVATRPQHEYTPLVRVIEARPVSHQLTVTAHGTVTPRTETSLVSEVSGRVVMIAPSFAAGGFFEEGDVLVTVDPRDYELAVITAKGAVAQAKVRAESEEAQARVARDEWQSLGDGEDSPLATRELQVQEARAALAAAEAALEQAERNLARTRIRAPFAGRIRAKMADVGQFVSPGVPVANIFAVDYVEVRLPVPDSDLAYLDLPLDYRGDASPKAGPAVRLHADFAGEHNFWTGRIVRIEGEIDPATRMVHVVAQVDDPYGLRGKKGHVPLSIGMFVAAEIFGREVDQVYMMPRSALRGDSGIFIVDTGGFLRFREVEILRIDRNEMIITSGLSAGDLVCVSVLEAATDGTKVRTAASPPPDSSRSTEAPETRSGS